MALGKPPVEAAAAGLRWRGLWLALGWLLVAIIVYLSTSPKLPSVFPTFRASDKVSHLLAYLVLTGWFLQLYVRPASRLLVVLLCVIMGVALEFVQGWGGQRHFDYFDMLANTLGALLAWALCLTPLGAALRWVETRFSRS